MSKEYLDALNIIKFNPDNVDGLQYLEAFKVVESALQRLESIDNANPSEALKCFDYIESKLEYATNEYNKAVASYGETNIQALYSLGEKTALEYVIKQFTTIKQALIKAQEQERVLEIIKEKNVDIELLKRSENWLDYYTRFKHRTGKNTELTEEEFDIVKKYI